MFKNAVTKLLISLTLLSTSAMAAEDDIKVLFVGTPQSGPPVILTQSFAQNLNVPNTFVSIKDCAGVMKFIDQNPNVAFFVNDMVTLTLKRQGLDCMPKFKTEDVIASVSSSWHVCKKPGGRDIGQTRFTFGISTVLPVAGVARDFNKRNSVGAVPVGVPSSAQAVAGILSGDIDWGMINPGVAEPLIQEGKLECPLTFIPQGTQIISSKAYIANHYDMTIPDLHTTYLLVIKSKDPKVKETAIKAVQSKGFSEFLDKSRYFNVKLGNYTQSDFDNFTAYITRLEKELY
jgi:hypothetical protein